MIVVSTEAQMRNLRRQYPSDEIVLIGTNRIQGLRVSEIVDRTFMLVTQAQRDEVAEWWEAARQCVVPD